MRTIFLDTETTGIEKDDRLIQVAYKYQDWQGPTVVNELFKPEKAIEIQAMATHHITEKMVADKIPFKVSPTFQHLRLLFANPENVLVAHNAAFDVGMLNKEGIEVPNIICTYKVAAALDKAGVIESYSLQYLRYFLGLEIEGAAHDAFGDVLVLEGLFARLFAKMKETRDQGEVFTEMIKISSQPMLINRFHFGKYNGRTLEDISKTDAGYLRWLLEQKLAHPDGEEDWIFTLQHHLKKPV